MAAQKTSARKKTPASKKASGPKKSASKKRSAPKRKTSKKNSSVHWFLRYHVTWWIVLLAVTTLTAVVVLRLPDKENSPQTTVHKEQKTHSIRAKVAKPHVKKSVSRPASRKSAARSYEEETETLETRIKELDLALVQTLAMQGYDPSGIRHGNVAKRRDRGGHEYYMQRLQLSMPDDVDGFLAALKKNIALLVQGGEMHYDRTDRQVMLGVNGAQTHVLVFAAAGKPVPKASAKDTDKARMVIVVDDLGRSVRAGERLASLSFPVTFSVMPCEPHSREVAALATNRRVELILHLPMQPESYPKTDPGPGALFVNMDARAIAKTTALDIAKVPGICGVNNHMGSRFTRDEAGMNVVMQVLGKHGLFFLDSVTTAKTCGQKAAARHHVPYLRRNVFLDNIRDTKAIIYQLRKAQALARKTGACIAICHPYPQTLEALKIWETKRDKQVRMVGLRNLLP